jgi:gliding motility-associated-like protein
MTRFVILLCSVLFSTLLQGQTCTTLGQNPTTAFPVCGTSTFSQSTVPICGGRSIPAPSCQSTGTTDKNPFWYKFTCFQSGTLEFLITPLDLNEDYDWQLFDVTGRNPMDVYTDPSMIVTYNWSGEFGKTGASPAGTQLYVCGGNGQPLFSRPANLVAGHEYLLLISHFSNSQSGYTLSFGGGSAAITDTNAPHLLKAESSCSGSQVSVKLNKKMKCSSITSSGSEFYITTSTAQVVSASGIGCGSGFDTDSLQLTLDQPLPPGNYTLRIRQGSDANTLLDLCNNGVPETDIAGFVVAPAQPTPMDSLVPPSCAPDRLRLVFPGPILCSSIAPNGSDFNISGPYPVTISSASATCNGATTRELTLQLSAPLQNAGAFTITLRAGSDGNTLLNECALATPAGSSLSFSVKDTVNAGFTYEKHYGCTADTVNFFHPGNNGVDHWDWDLGDGRTSSLQNPEVIYPVFNTKNITLKVSNGFCTGVSSQSVVLDNIIKADFTAYEDNCPNEPVQFTSAAQGNVKQHSWRFGDGGTSAQPSPTHTYPAPLRETAYNVEYTVTDSLGCSHTARKPVRIYSSCYLAVPTAFSPNNDGLNDRFYPANAIKAENLQFMVYNRWGQLIFKTANWKQGWDGTVSGKAQPPGVYVWFLSYFERGSKVKREMKGTVMLVR